jgi:hypothetical protein
LARGTRIRFWYGCLVVDGPARHAGARLHPVFLLNLANEPVIEQLLTPAWR